MKVNGLGRQKLGQGRNQDKEEIPGSGQSMCGYTQIGYTPGFEGRTFISSGFSTDLLVVCESQAVL